MTNFLDTYDALEIVEGLGFRVKDLGLLHAAVARPQAHAYGEDAYASLELKAAAFAHSVANNDSLLDGNRRTSWVTLNAFLHMNEYTLNMTDVEGEDFVLGLATERFNIEQAATRIRKKMVKLK
jgi:death-on-curing protein